MPAEIVDPVHQAFYALAAIGVWSGVACAVLLCFVLGQHFTKAVF